MAFDELDRRIVAALVEDGRATYAEIGTRVGLSAPAVKRRVDRLRASGAITGFSASVNPGLLGWTTEARSRSTRRLTAGADRPTRVPISA